MTEIVRAPVLIVGGGGAGLALSVFLSNHGVEHLLVERHSSTSHLPKAHYINQRAMEILRRHGCADAVYAKSAPRANHGKIRWITSLGGDGPFDGVELLAMDIMGSGGLTARYDAAGPAHPTHIPQIRLEPILRSIADDRADEATRFGHEVQSIDVESHYVTAHVVNHTNESAYRIVCDYLVAADAGKTIGPALGVSMVGDTNRGDFYSVWFEADLSSYIQHDDACMRRFYHPDTPHRVGSLLTFGPDHWDRHSREWVTNFAAAPGAHDQTDDQIVAEALDYLRVDVPTQVRRVSRWRLEAIVADRFSFDRIHLIGDAGHKHPPTTGLGLNSALQDADNIAWKLALAVKGSAPPQLVGTFESDRRKVVTDNAAWAMFTNTNRAILMTALGAIPGESAERAGERFGELLEDSRTGRARRAQLREIFAIRRVEYAAHDMELGYRYQGRGVIPDGSVPAERDPIASNYLATTEPGARLPHVWLQSADGKRVSTHDLVPLSGFGLLSGRDGHAWTDAAAKVASELGIGLRVALIGTEDLEDPDGTWASVCGTTSSGLVLVRPDEHVSFRMNSMPADPVKTLLRVLEQVLELPVVATENLE